MVGLSSPGESGGGASESGESGGSPETPEGVEVGPVVPGSDGETVEFFEEERPLPEAVSLMAEVLDQPEAFGIVEDGDLLDLREEVEELRERVDQQEKAIGDLAAAVEALSAKQADVAGMDGSGTVFLEADAFGEIYQPSKRVDSAGSGGERAE